MIAYLVAFEREFLCTDHLRVRLLYRHGHALHIVKMCSLVQRQARRPPTIHRTSFDKVEGLLWQ